MVDLFYFKLNSVCFSGRDVSKISDIKYGKIQIKNHILVYSTNMIPSVKSHRVPWEMDSDPYSLTGSTVAGSGAVVRGLPEAVHFPAGERLGCSSMNGSFRFRFLGCNRRGCRIRALHQLRLAVLDVRTDRSGH